MKLKALITGFALVGAIASIQTASAELSIAKGKKLCKSAAMEQIEPTPAHARVDAKSIYIKGSMMTFDVTVKSAEGEKSDAECTIDREAATATVVAKTEG